MFICLQRQGYLLQNVLSNIFNQYVAHEHFNNKTHHMYHKNKSVLGFYPPVNDDCTGLSPVEQNKVTNKAMNTLYMVSYKMLSLIHI